MRREFVGNSVGVKSVLLLVLALVMFIGVGPALAQDLTLKKNMDIDFFKFGKNTNLKANGKILYASGILSASDTDKDIFRKDGTSDLWDYSPDGRLDTRRGYSKTLKVRMDRPIIGNIEKGDQLNLMTIVEGLLPADVATLRAGTVNAASNPVMSAILARITADVSPEFFAYHTASSVYTGVHPTFATSTYDLYKVADATERAEIALDTSVVVYWENASLVVSATDSKQTNKSLGAVISIDGSTLASKRAQSNFVGIETGINSAPQFYGNWNRTDLSKWDDLDQLNKKGMLPGVNLGIRINAMTDTTSLPYYGQAGTLAFNPAVFLDAPTNKIPFQFRKGDLMNILLQVVPNEDLDGEPDEYFGAGGSDKLYSGGVFQLANDGIAKNKAESQLIGTKLVLTGNQSDDNTTVLNPTSYNFSEVFGNYQILRVDAAIANTVITSGTFQAFKVKALIQDEVGSATEALTNHALDVAGPLYTNVRAENEVKVPFGNVGMANANLDEARFGLEIDGNGETITTTAIQQWLNITLYGFGRDHTGTVVQYVDMYPSEAGINSKLVDLDNLGDASSVVTLEKKESGLITNLFSSSKILGASVVIRIKNNVSTTILSGGLIASVSDDARNPAILYPSKTDPNTFIAWLDSTVNYYSGYMDVTQINPFTGNIIKSATVEVDNTPPSILAAQFSVVNLPAGYWNDGSSTQEAFNLLRTTGEAVANIWGGVNDPKRIIRGTSAVAGKQNGSPVRLVVKFNPVGNPAAIGDDLDYRQFPDGTPASRAQSFKNRFTTDLSNLTLGYKTAGDGKNYVGASFSDDTARWVVEDATIFTGANANIAWVTFVEPVGIPAIAPPGTLNAPLSIGMKDIVYNNVAGNSNGILVDVLSPTVSGLTSSYQSTSDGVLSTWGASPYGAAPSTLLFIANKKVNAPATIDWTADPRTWGSTINAHAERFVNGSDILAANNPPVVQAGYTLIVSANFQEPWTGSSSPFTQIGTSYSGFPFLFELPLAADPYVTAVPPLSNWYLDVAGTLYGRAFKTISADFGDFVTDARDVLPDVWTNNANASTRAVAQNDSVRATWFYSLDGNKNLNLKSPADIRRVTLTARDLSGNVYRFGIAAATAAFVKPQVAILNYEIDNPARGVRRSVVERSSSYLGGAGVAAVSLSQATVNLNNATVLVVAKIGDGVSKGGPLVASNFLYADFTALGGGLEAPDKVTFANGTAVTNGNNVSASSIIWATWYSEKFTNAAKDTAGAASAKIIIGATGVTMGIGTGETVPVQVDLIPPALTVTNVLEERADDGAPTNPTGDLANDLVVRPGQIVTVRGNFLMDTADKKNVNVIKFAADLSQFGNPIPSSRVYSDTFDRRWVDYQFQIPRTLESGFYKTILYATDAAANWDKETNPDFITVNAARPEVQTLVLSASNTINYATGVKGITNAWRWIGTRQINDPGNPLINGAVKPTIVRAGDMLIVTAVVKINDSVFSKLNVTADFSDFSGSAFKTVVPKPYSSPNKDTIQQGTHVAGNVYYATWVHTIVPSNQNILDASVRINAVNPAGIAATGLMLYSVPLTVDNKGPLVTETITLYKNGTPTTASEVNPNNIARFQVGRVTAAIVVNATFTEADVNYRFGYAGAIFSALYTQKGWNLDNKSAQDAAFRLNADGIAENSYPFASLFTLSNQTGVFNNQGSSTDGIVVSSATPITLANQASLKWGTHTVMNIWFGKDPTKGGQSTHVADATGQFAVGIKQGIAQAGAILLTSVSDVVGNKSTPTGLAAVEFDGKAPVISRGNKPSSDTVLGVTLDVAPGQTAYVDFVPAVYKGTGASAILQRPTRVTQGTVVRILGHLFDNPDTTDPITMMIQGSEFNSAASTFVVNSPSIPAGNKVINAANDKFLTLNNIDPTQFANNVIPIAIDVPVGAPKSNAGYTTLPYDTSSWQNAKAYYPLANVILPPGAGDKASLLLQATDTVDNTVGTYANIGLEVDTQGPGVVTEFTSFLPSKEEVDKINTVSPVSIPTSRNANAGSWLVWAATLVIDGTNDLDLPLDKFTINWAEIYEFDTSRFVYNDISPSKGKKYIVSSATRSIVFVTQTIKVKDDADPRNADLITYHLEDLFGNVTSAKTVNYLGINAKGPLATEVSLKVDGKAQAIVGLAKLGIGNKWPDSVASTFEIYPGAKVIVEATVTTYQQKAPDTILADLSDLYPIGFKAMTDEVIPSYQQVTAAGTVYAKWEYVAYNLWNLLPARTVPNDLNYASARNYFFDQGNLNWLVYGYGYNPRTSHSKSPAAVDRIPFNGPIAGATPASQVDYNGITTANSVYYTGVTPNQVTHNPPANFQANLVGGPRANGNMANFPAALNALQGLPFIQVQRDATAKKVASVTIFVDEEKSIYPFEESLSNYFAVDTEPPRASYVYSVTQALPVRSRFLSGPRIGFPTAPNADFDRKNGVETRIVRPMRVRQNDSVAVIVKATNSLIDRSGNDALRTLPGYFPADLSTGIFRIDAANDASIKDVTIDLSGFSSVPGVENMSVMDPNAPVANPAFPNIVTIDSQGANTPDLITAIFSVKVTKDRGLSVAASKDPVEATPTLVDDAGNRIFDTPYDKRVIQDYRDDDNNTGTTNDWVALHPQTILAVDNLGPSINGDVLAKIISGSARAYDPGTGNMTIQNPGENLKDEAIVAPGTILQVTVFVTDLVDHPLDLIIDKAKNNYGDMFMYATGLKLANSVLDAAEARLTGADTIGVPFNVTLPSKETGKSTFSFRFVIQATDTVGNMTVTSSLDKFAFDANPDLVYYDAAGKLVETNSITVNAGSASQLILSASALDVGGLTTMMWNLPSVPGITFEVKDEEGNVVDGIFDAGNAQFAQLDLFALIPVIDGGVTPFTVSAVANDIEGNTSEINVVTVNINQPPIIAASLPFTATDDGNVVTQEEIIELTGAGYNTAFADIREVTIEEGTTIDVLITADDMNVSDTVTLSATGTAITSPAIQEGLATVTSGAGTGELAFSFTPGYMAVTGTTKSATFALDVKASDGSTILPDTMSLVFNVLAKSATPVVWVESIKVGGVSRTPNGLVEMNEGQTVQIVYGGYDPGEEPLTVLLEGVPATIQAATEVAQSVASGVVIYWGTFTYTAGYQDADVPEVGYDSLVDPLFSNFVIANASYASESSKGLVPIDILNVSQAPLVTAKAAVGAQSAVTVVDGAQITAEAGSLITIQYRAVDPDGDNVITTLIPVITPGTYDSIYTIDSIGLGFFESTLVVTVPSDAALNDTASIVFTAKDVTGKERTFTLTILVNVSHPEIPNLIVAQGDGGTNTVNWKNLDPNVTQIDGKPVLLTSTYRSVAVASGPFLADIGGGVNRAAYPNMADIDGDGDLDIVLTMGPVTEPDAKYPNIVVVKDAKTRQLIGNSFVAFQKGSDPINYEGGEVRTAVGHFFGTSVGAQIVTAQGFGGNNKINIYQYTGLPKPDGFQVQKTIDGLVAAALTNNASAGLTLAAGDLTGDGFDELIIGQTNSNTSRTQFTVISFSLDGKTITRTPGVAFNRKFQGNGGINIAVVDLDDNGTNELVFTSAGNSKDFVVDTDRNTVPSGLVTILVPVVESGVVTGFTKPAKNVFNVFDETMNPSNGVSVAGIDLDGVANGKELVFGTQSLLSIDGTSVVPVKPAPEARYAFRKVDYVDGVINGLYSQSELLLPGTYPGFAPDYNPTSGAVNLTTGLTK